MDPYRPSQAYEPHSPPAFGAVREIPSQKHSSLGIASFSLSLLAGIGMFGTVVAAGVAEASNPGGMNEESATAIIIGLSIFLFVFLQLVAVGLGIGGLFQHNTKKIFAILGIVFAAGSMLCIVGLMAIGMTMQA